MEFARHPATRHMSKEPKAARLAHVDSLRAIAALLVVWMHVSERFYSLGPQVAQSRWVYDLALTLDVGRLGVVLFFAISGFVVPFSIRADSPAPVREFLLRRAFRILPAYWLSIPLGAFTSATLWGVQFPLWAMLVNMTLLQYWLGVRSAMGLYWTLVLEMLFYFCCAALLAMRSIDNHRRIAVIAIGLVAIELLGVLSPRLGYSGQVYLTSLWFFHLGIMFWGCLFRAWQDGRLEDRFARMSMWGLFAYLVLVYPLLCGWVAKFPLNYYLPYSLAIALFVAGTTWMKLRSAVLVRIGEISYSVYLLHPVVFLSMLWLLMRLPVSSWWRSQHLAAYVVANMLVTIVLATVTYRWIEQPGIAMGRRLAHRWFQRPVAALPSAA